MTGTGTREFFQSFDFVIGIDDLHANRTAKSDALPSSTEEFRFVRFQLLALASSVTTLSSFELFVDSIFVDLQSSGKAIYQRKHRASVGFSSSQISQHVQVTVLQAAQSWMLKVLAVLIRGRGLLIPGFAGARF